MGETAACCHVCRVHGAWSYLQDSVMRSGSATLTEPASVQVPLPPAVSAPRQSAWGAAGREVCAPVPIMIPETRPCLSRH